MLAMSSADVSVPMIGNALLPSRFTADLAVSELIDSPVTATTLRSRAASSMILSAAMSPDARPRPPGPSPPLASNILMGTSLFFCATHTPRSSSTRAWKLLAVLGVSTLRKTIVIASGRSAALRFSATIRP